MDALVNLIISMLADPVTMLSVLVFLAVTVLAFGVMGVVHARTTVQRRAAEILSLEMGPSTDDPRSLRYASRQAAKRLAEYTTKYYSESSQGNDMRQLRRKLVQAGFLDARAVGFFFLARLGLAMGLAAIMFVAPLNTSGEGNSSWMFMACAGLVGYMGPSFYLNRRIKQRQQEHRDGFPDFMDLLVVCADAGLSMEAGLERVGREIGDSYPSLSSNVHMATLELRAGRKLSETLEHFGDRLGLDEARSFATLLQQSEELGSSMSDALRVYSDDMRHKRMSAAEEKAHKLPAKLSVPLILCVFPVVMIIIILPVVVRLKMG
ncbi:MAG TPA: type II secretion system F family protein [Xanthobacteraceae bacterium]|jgi:tight adherence protein C|nr:type II secretion system F family protein [Xanthobacteraceae bacterium]